MIRKRAFITGFSLIMVLGLILGGCGGSTPAGNGATQPQSGQGVGTAAPAEHPKMDVELLGANGTVQQAAIGIADTIAKVHPWIRMSATGTANTEANITQMIGRDPNTALYMVSSTPFVSAKHAVGQFAGKEPLLDQRMIAGFMYGVNGLVTLDSNIKSISDLNGKTIAMFADELPQQVYYAAFDILGIKVTIKTMSFGDQFNALADGLVDACLYLGTGNPGKPFIPVSNLQEVVVTKRNKVYPISFPAELQLQAVEKAGLQEVWPYQPVTALAGSLHEEQTEPFELYGSTTVALACMAGADEELVYEVTKTIAENTAKLKDYLPALEGMAAEDMLSLLHMIEGENEIHPGALKYYKEIGIWPSVWEAANK